MDDYLSVLANTSSSRPYFIRFTHSTSLPLFMEMKTATQYEADNEMEEIETEEMVQLEMEEFFGEIDIEERGGFGAHEGEYLQVHATRIDDLHRAIKKDDIDEVRRFLLSYDFERDLYDVDNYTALEVAIDHAASLQLIRVLLDHGAGLDDAIGQSLLTLAVSAYHAKTTLSIIKLLLEFGYDANKRELDDTMAEALNNRKAKADDVVKYLLQNSLVSLNTMDMNQEQFTTMICNAFMHLKENTLLAYVLTDIDTPMWKNALMACLPDSSKRGILSLTKSLIDLLIVVFEFPLEEFPFTKMLQYALRYCSTNVVLYLCQDYRSYLDMTAMIDETTFVEDEDIADDERIEYCHVMDADEVEYPCVYGDSLLMIALRVFLYSDIKREEWMEVIKELLAATPAEYLWHENLSGETIDSISEQLSDFDIDTMIENERLMKKSIAEVALKGCRKRSREDFEVDESGREED